MAPAATQLLKESLVLIAVGVAVALAANALSPRGLELRRDYFLTQKEANAPSSANVVAATLPVPDKATFSKRGIRMLAHEEVAALYEDPRRLSRQILFVDARNAERFAAGHIPGALQFDHYRPDKHVESVLGVLPLAEKIVVYCNGGDCEDSDLVVADLIALGVPEAKLVIYAGGFAEWKRRSMPIATDSKGGTRP